MYRHPHPARIGSTLALRLLAAAAAMLLIFSLVGCGDDEAEQAISEAPASSAANSEGAGSGSSSSAGAKPAAAPSSGSARPATPQPQPVAEVEEIEPPAAAAGTWTVMLYLDADDDVLEKDIYIDLNEAERIGSSDEVTIVAQVDRYRGGFSGDGNWSAARRFYLTQDDDLNALGSEEVDNLGEVDMSDPQTLVDFAVWAIDNYPAEKYVLIMSDHGSGWPGGWYDPAPGRDGGEAPDLPIADEMGNMMYLMEMDQALQDIRDQTGIDTFEIIGLDACLMGYLEVFAMLAPHARYALASQEVEPAVGWAYASFLGALVENPNMNGANLATAVVESYINEDQRILDPAARREFVRSDFDGTMTVQELVAELGYDVTLTAADLSKLPAVIDATNQLAFALQGINQKSVAKARTHAQSFTSIFGDSEPSPSIDLTHFASVIQKQSKDPAVQTAVGDLYQSVEQFVVALKRGPDRSGAYGISVYFPNSKLYRSRIAGMRSYTAVADRFSQVSLWDDFLTYHYTGREFEADAVEAVVPPTNAEVVAPGAAEFAISELTVSAEVTSPGNPITLGADISGDNIGYIYLYAGYYDEASNSINVLDTDYIDSGETVEIDGVVYPEWGVGAFSLEYDWEPIAYELSDGESSTLAWLQPLEYGASAEEAVYGVDGLYESTSGEAYWAQLQMVDGYEYRLIIWLDDNATGSTRVVVPQPGDQFTVLEHWQDLDDEGYMSEESDEYGGTLTFGEQPITWQEVDAPAGYYIVGFMVEDLDGGLVETYATVTVE